MSLTKAWWNRALFGAKSGERHPLKLPDRRDCIPVARDHLASSSRNAAGIDGCGSNLAKLARGPFRLRTPSTRRASGAHSRCEIAGVRRDAGLEPDSSDRLRWADLAVSLDPSLTSIYFQMDHFYLPEYQLTEAEFAPRAARLQQWDSSNSVVYLMQADRLVDSAKWNYGYSDFGGKYGSVTLLSRLRRAIRSGPNSWTKRFARRGSMITLAADLNSALR